MKAFFLSVWSVVLFAAGVFFASKIDKPDTVVNNSIGKIKGQNDVTNTPETAIENKQIKKRFKLFGNKRN